MGAGKGGGEGGPGRHRYLLFSQRRTMKPTGTVAACCISNVGSAGHCYSEPQQGGTRVWIRGISKCKKARDGHKTSSCGDEHKKEDMFCITLSPLWHRYQQVPQGLHFHRSRSPLQHGFHCLPPPPPHSTPTLPQSPAAPSKAGG